MDAILKEIKEPYGRPTDVIGFGPDGENIANDLLPIIGRKEICFFDEKVKFDAVFHYLDFLLSSYLINIMTNWIGLIKR